MKVTLDAARCQGHGRCYELAPDVFGEDEEGYAVVLGEGVVPDGLERAAGLAEGNCPERAIAVLDLAAAEGPSA